MRALVRNTLLSSRTGVQKYKNDMLCVLEDDFFWIDPCFRLQLLCLQDGSFSAAMVGGKEGDEEG